MPTMRTKTSAGLLMYRFRESGVEIFLAHPGGPFFARKDNGHWTIPKGEIEPGEDMLAAACREFLEEVGKPSQGPYTPLGSVRQNRGKTVYAWAFLGDWEEDREVSSTLFQMEWPPASGKIQKFPEVDRAGFFSLNQARTKIKGTQSPFIDRLLAYLKDPTAPGTEPTETPVTTPPPE